MARRSVNQDTAWTGAWILRKNEHFIFTAEDELDIEQELENSEEKKEEPRESMKGKEERGWWNWTQDKEKIYAAN